MREKTLRRTTAADEIQILDSHRDFYVISALGDVIEQNVCITGEEKSNS